MDIHQKQLIKDNPNLSSSALARFLCFTHAKVSRNRETPLWAHRGHGIPFTFEQVMSDGVYLILKFRGRVIANGKLPYILENLDRLIYCLENNNGNLPPTLEDWSLKNLEFKHD